MLCLTCGTPLLARAVDKSTSQDGKTFQMTVPCTGCHAIWRVTQLELRSADPERVKMLQPANDPNKRVTYCTVCSEQLVVGKEGNHKCVPVEMQKSYTPPTTT